MKLLQQLLALFRPKSAPVAVPPTGYSDEEFLRVMMEQARKRTPTEPAAASKLEVPGSLPTAA